MTIKRFLFPFIFYFSTPALAIEDSLYWNLGAEGGLSTVDGIAEFGGHIALRTSVTKVKLQNNFRHVGPVRWSGGYLRYERNLQGNCVGFGYGHSAYMSILGFEYGMLLAPGNVQAVGYGAEVTALLTFGMVGMYVRESVMKDDDLSWQSDVGLRLQFPIGAKE